MTTTATLPADKRLINTAPYTLRKLTLFNWGPFMGFHDAQFSPEGTALIGPTGSGKTTLVDALMTLLTAQPKYNLASTGGHESDRDLMSYIRGVSGPGNNSGDNQHVTRPNKSVTGLCATLSNNRHSVHLAGLFWIDSSSCAAVDLKRLWLFGEGQDHSLKNWLSLHEDGGTRALKQWQASQPSLNIHDNKKHYLAQVRRFFEVGDNAFTLLNRAAGLKQLNSIDVIFRELVLDNNDAFDRAGEVVKEFDDLASIHSELETAQRQQASLLPIQLSQQDFQKNAKAIDTQNELLNVLPVWYATLAHRLWQARTEQLEAEHQQQTLQLQTLHHQEEDLQGQATTLNDLYLQAGGASIEQLESQIGTQRTLCADRQRHANDYQTLSRTLGINEQLNAASLAENQLWATTKIAEQETLKGEREQAAYTVGAQLIQCTNKLEELQQEQIKISQHPSSNVPGVFQDFRNSLARELNLMASELPFAAELLEVKSADAEWRGAIERALGSHRLRILVPSTAIDAAMSWVNQRNNRLHVRLLEAKVPEHSARFMDDGFSRKLNYKPHPLREALKHLVAGIDRHCVNTVSELKNITHGLTREGMMSGKRHHFDKHDHQALNDNWMTGFDNKDRLAKLNQSLNILQQEKQTLDAKLAKCKTLAEEHGNTLTLLQRLCTLDFESIDLPSTQATLDTLKQQLQTLNNPKSSVGQARQNYHAVLEQIKVLQKKSVAAKEKTLRLEVTLQDATKRRSACFSRIKAGLNHEQLILAETHLPSLDDASLDSADELERQSMQNLNETLKAQEEKQRELSLRLVRLMSDAHKADTGALSEIGRELEDIPAYLERLRVLTEEALPEKRQRFLTYLNQSSDQGVAQLLSDIENEVSLIEERIDDLNASLHPVDYQNSRYLQLRPQRVVHDSLRQLHNAQRVLRSAALKDDEGKSHFRALENMVTLLREACDSKRTLGARALLDPRYRLQFSVAIMDRLTAKVMEVRTGSQGGSGGEKEIIASYILTASLSYALCPLGEKQPLFGTIVLDEAFSKSSPAVATRIIAALKAFHLHALFVTPNKELRLLRSHTQSAILVHNKAQQSNLICLSWEALEQQAQKHKSVIVPAQQI